MKIAIAQINPLIGALEDNARKIIQFANEAKAKDADLVCFPELALTGYPPKDLLLRQDFLDRQKQIIEEVLCPSAPLPILFGGVYQEGQTGALYNSAYFIAENKIQKIIHKKLLPNYEVFNEGRYFKAGNAQDPSEYFIEYQNHKIAVFVCEDLLGLENDFADYKNNPLEILQNEKFDLSICLAASPFRTGQKQIRFNILQAAQEKLHCPICLVNRVGANDNLIFDGSSLVFVDKEHFLPLPSFVESLEVIDLKANFQQQSIKSDENIEIRDALVLGIRDYFHKTGFKKALIGLSGGVDSALVTTLAVYALGCENVHVLMMPSKYSSSSSIDDSLELVKNLGITYEIIKIDGILDEFLKATNLKALTLAEENAQSRIRGFILMGKANEKNALVLVTGNKSELAVGYSTLYGDSCGAIAPIADLWKTQVWNLSKLCPEIPENIISKSPSAELRPDQKDTDSLPDYTILDQLMKLYIEEHLSAEELEQRGFLPETINRILRMHQINEFKRKQYPPILKVSKRSFSEIDWQENITKS